MIRQLRIGPDLVSDDSPCYVIAELGHNHQGKLDVAKALIKAAHECGANAVKLQKRDSRSLYTRAMYESAGEQLWANLRPAPRCARVRSGSVSGTSGLRAADIRSSPRLSVSQRGFLAKLDMPAYKIASGDLRNIPLILHIARWGKPLLVSTGGGTIEDVQRVYEAVMPVNPALCFLQCTASYPAEPEHMNLRVITTFRESFPDVTVGLSDHQNGISMSVAAYVLGARVIEKHFTLNHAWKGTDHAFSLEPIGMRKMIRDLSRTGEALGDGIKRPFPEELGALYKMGKKLVAARDLPAGHVLTASDIAIKSPDDGLPPYEIDKIIGKRIQHSLAEDENIRISLAVRWLVSATASTGSGSTDPDPFGW
jgi:N-acetylneuraminate synthase/sialic acid synthase